MDFLYKNNIFPGVHYIDNTKHSMYSLEHISCGKARF